MYTYVHIYVNICTCTIAGAADSCTLPSYQLLKISLFWDVDTVLINFYRRFRGVWCLQLQGSPGKISFLGGSITFLTKTGKEGKIKHWEEERNEEMNLLFHYLMQPFLPSILFFFDQTEDTGNRLLQCCRNKWQVNTVLYSRRPYSSSIML